MKKAFVNPDLEVVRFGGKDIVSTSNVCCDVAGFQFDTDNEACESKDSHCTCTPDYSVNC